MCFFRRVDIRKAGMICIAGMVALSMAACRTDNNLIVVENEEKRVVELFSPMEKSEAYVENTARSAADKTVMLAEEKLDVSVGYVTYTAEDYQDKTYDDVTLDRARNDMDDIYLLNPDTLRVLGEEGKLKDLSGLECVKNLREVVIAANMIDGKLVGIPQEVVAYGLFINKDMFDQYGLALPETPEDFLECCRVFKENGIETPVGANRWWLETFVLAQAYADLYNGGNTEAEIAALNSGESKYSDYMRPGFEFLQEMIDKGICAIILSPVDWEKITPSLQALKEAGVRIINVDTQVREMDYVDAYIGSDNYSAGYICGEDLIEKCPEGGKIAILECPTQNSINDRITGFEEAIAKAAKGFEVVARADTTGEFERALEESEKMLKEHPDIVAIMCGNDQIAVGATTSVNVARAKEVLIYGVDGSPDIKKELQKQDTQIAGTAAQSPIHMGKNAAEIADCILTGQKFEKETYEEVFMINKDNVGMYGVDGWQ